MRQEVEDYHSELVEHVCNVDEPLGDIFLEDRKPTTDELKGIHSRII